MMSAWPRGESSRELNLTSPPVSADCSLAHRHHTMATLRRDGSPRISGTEVDFKDGDLFLGMMPRAVRALDLRRDGRAALHSATVDTPTADPSSREGDAKISGRGVEVKDSDRADGAHRFRFDIREVLLTK
jgi:hypothetical protein